MSLIRQLGYSLPERNRLQVSVARFFQTRVGAWIGHRMVPKVDRLALKMSGGSGTGTGWFAGVPPMWLATTGAYSGEVRTTALFGVPFDDDLAVLGTSFAQPSTPAWVHNLVAQPNATVTFRGTTVTVVARPATSDEEEEIWAAAADMYAGFSTYRRRLTNREARVFVLEDSLPD